MTHTLPAVVTSAPVTFAFAVGSGILAEGICSAATGFTATFVCAAAITSATTSIVAGAARITGLAGSGPLMSIGTDCTTFDDPFTEASCASAAAGLAQATVEQLRSKGYLP